MKKLLLLLFICSVSSIVVPEEVVTECVQYRWMKDKSCSTYKTGGGYDPKGESANLKTKQKQTKKIIPSKIKFTGKQNATLEFRRDITLNKADIHELRFTEYNYDLKDDGSDFWPKDELTKDCSEISEKFLMTIQPIKTGLSYKYIANKPSASKADMEVIKLAKWKNAVLNVKVSQFNEHSIMATDITANYHIYKYRSSIPIVDVTIEECTEVKLDGFTIDFSKAKKVSTQWFPYDKKEQLWISGLTPIINTEEGTVDLRDNLGSAKSNSTTEVTIECRQPNCSENLKQTIFLDLKSARKAYDIKQNEIAKAREESLKESRRIAKEEEVRWEKQKKKMQEDAAIYEKEEKLKKIHRKLEIIRSTSLNKLSDEQKKVKIIDAKQQCLSLGFKLETSQLRKCIMELI